MRMKTKIGMASLAAALFGASAIAGFVQPFPVDVDLTNGIASGDMLSARNADNDNEYIGCGVRAIDDGAGGTVELGFCQAEDADTEQVTCFTQNANLLDTIRLADYSFVTFSFVDDGAGGFECARIGFSTQSFYLPDDKKPK